LEKCEPISHEVGNLDSSVVNVGVLGKSAKTSGGSFCEGVGDETITGLEANLGLEGVLTNGTNHLEGDIGAVE
jgi:hypothetical protein|tara:strand:- start:114 stop:332 length:219 start_codon:yes stop_codon:yes gene_type:complete